MDKIRSIGQVVLKLTGPCNLNCRYCYVYNAEDKSYRSRPKEISDEVFDAVLRRIKEHCEGAPDRKIGIGFHGGEPTLLGVDRFRQLVSRTRSVLGTHLRGLAIQTNGTLIDEFWASTFREMAIGVGISIDGPALLHDAARVDHAGQGSHAATVRGLKALQDAGISPTILCVVTPGESGADVYRYFRELGI